MTSLLVEIELRQLREEFDQLKEAVTPLLPKPKGPLVSLEEAERRAKESIENCMRAVPVGNGIECPKCSAEMTDSGHGVSYGDGHGYNSIHCPKCLFRSSMPY